MGLCRGRAARGRESSAEQEPKGQKYLSKDERKYKWDLAAGQSPVFFARWPAAASGGCEVLIHYTQSRPNLLRWIWEHAVTSRTVMCTLLYAAPTMAFSFSKGKKHNLVHPSALLQNQRCAACLTKCSPSLQNLHTASLQKVLHAAACCS